MSGTMMVMVPAACAAVLPDLGAVLAMLRERGAFLR